MFGRIYYSFCSGVKLHPTPFTSSSAMFQQDHIALVWMQHLDTFVLT